LGGRRESRFTLAAAEADLAELLMVDPYCVGPLRSTKGHDPRVRSFYGRKRR
jgi:hypothetical protein